ncbi:hypothetical protein [Methylosoma difficile]
MKKASVIRYACFALIFHFNNAYSQNWPQLDRTSQSKSCVESLKIAKAVFSSSAFYLYDPPVLPENASSSVVLGSKKHDISGGDALEANSIFDKLPKGGQDPRSVYWQQQADAGFRLALVEDAFGWRGDIYTLYAIKEAITAKQFIAEINTNEKSLGLTPVIGDLWRPPLIIQDKPSGQLWVIDVGHPADFLGHWQAYGLGAGGLKPSCKINFRPDAKYATNVLPKPIRQFAKLLDSTIGPGLDEGTLQSTAWIRIKVQHVWANMALRPWVSYQPYNSRKEVDAGLLAWSQHGKSYLKTYQDIQREYVLAKRSLANYYRRRFHKSAAEAKALAAEQLDLAYRSHYTFHQE